MELVKADPDSSKLGTSDLQPAGEKSKSLMVSEKSKTIEERSIKEKSKTIEERDQTEKSKSSIEKELPQPSTYKENFPPDESSGYVRKLESDYVSQTTG